MRWLLTLPLVLAMGIGCNGDNTGTDDGIVDDTENPDNTDLTGMALVTADGLNVDGEIEQCTFHAFIDDVLVVSCQTGEACEVPTDANGENVVFKHGDISDEGCDGQFLHSGTRMALDIERELADGDEADLGTPTGFPYYEWNGALQCEAWDDWGWEETYGVEDTTNGNTTCVDANGTIDFDELNITFDFSSGSVTSDQSSGIGYFTVDENGFEAFLESGSSYIRCDVVD